MYFRFRTWHDFTSKYDAISLPNMARFHFRTLFWLYSVVVHGTECPRHCVDGRANVGGRVSDGINSSSIASERLFLINIPMGGFFQEAVGSCFMRSLRDPVLLCAAGLGVIGLLLWSESSVFVMKWVVWASATRPAGFLYFAKRSVENAKIAWRLAEMRRISERQSLNLVLIFE